MNSYPRHLLSHMGTRNRQSIWRIFLNTFWRAFLHSSLYSLLQPAPWEYNFRSAPLLCSQPHISRSFTSSQIGWRTHSSESIPGLHERLKIRAQAFTLETCYEVCRLQGHFGGFFLGSPTKAYRMWGQKLYIFFEQPLHKSGVHIVQRASYICY